VGQTPRAHRSGLEEIAPLLPASGRPGGQWADHRRVLNGILWKLATGVPWRDLPERYGPWQTCYERSAAGRPMAPGNACSPTPRPSPMRSGRSTGRWSVDATVVRAHQHAAGARKGDHPTT
jgi:transposase